MHISRWNSGEIPNVTGLVGGPFSQEQVRQRLEREIKSMAEYGIQYWPIFLRESGEHVGCCGLRPYMPRVPELGVHLRPKCWRMGFAEEAAAAVIRCAFQTPGYEELFAGDHPENTASKRLLEKVGFVHIGEELYKPTQLMHPAYRLRKPASSR